MKSEIPPVRPAVKPDENQKTKPAEPELLGPGMITFYNGQLGVYYLH